MGYLPEEASFLPWHAASRALYQLDKLLDRTDDYHLFSVRRSLPPSLARLHLPTHPSPPPHAAPWPLSLRVSLQDYALKQVAARYHQMGWPGNTADDEDAVLQASHQTE